MSMDKWFYEQARLGNVYHSHNTTTGLVTVLSATCTGLVLSNPIGSGKLLVMKNAKASSSVVGAAICTIGLAVNPSKATAVQTGTAAVVHNGLNSGSNANNGVANPLTIATLLTVPVWYRSMGTFPITGGVEGNSFSTDFDGDTIVQPGGYIAFSTLTTTRNAMLSMTWAEIDE